MAVVAAKIPNGEKHQYHLSGKNISSSGSALAGDKRSGNGGLRVMATLVASLAPS